MSHETTDNFFKAMAEFEWPETTPVSYRLYYTDTGAPECYTMENLPGKYIEVDQETYVLARWNVQVIDNKIHIIAPTVTIQKLQPNTTTGAPCHVADVCVIVNPDQPHTKWNKTTNEIS